MTEKTKKFLQKLKDKGYYYEELDYSKVDFIDGKTKALITDRLLETEHLVIPNNILNRGDGCTFQNSKDKTKYILAKLKYGGYYYEDQDYSKVNYSDYYSKVIIIYRPLDTIHTFSPSGLLGSSGGRCSIINAVDKNEFYIKMVKKIHGNDFDHSLVNFVDMGTKITVKCNKCLHVFDVTANNHLRRGCPKCALRKRGATQRLTKEEFVEKSIKKHGDKCDYSNFIYKNSHTKGEIICKEHGPFEQSPSGHLNGTGCVECNCKRLSERNTSTKEEFTEKAIKIHGNDYDYSNFNYISTKINGDIGCNNCGNEFQQTPSTHLNGSGCQKCSLIKRGNSRRSNTKEFILKAEQVHIKGRYNYDDVDYETAIIPVKIWCNDCGQSFFQTPHRHLGGCGCSICNTSKGELKIKGLLDSLKIDYVQQKTFEDCKNISVLRFDYFIQSQNLLIEYNGEQHYKPMDFFGGQSSLEYQCNNDQIKVNYCKNNNIELLIIPYTEFDNIESIIKDKVI